MTALLELDGVTAGYDAGVVVRDVSLRVGAGEVVCVLGPNGAGKTTLLRAVSGLMPHVTGAVRFDGRALARMPAHRRARAGIALVPEGRRNVIPTLTVEENLRLAGGLPSVAGELFPVLAERHAQRAGTLSGGQQQMLAIALALALRPKLLLVDEPSAGLAPSVVEEVLERLVQLKEHGIAMLLAEQRVDLALRVAGRGYVMETGRVTAEDTAAGLAANPLLRESYLGA